MNPASPFDFAPLLRLAMLGLVLASAPLAWVWLRHRGEQSSQRQRSLTLLTLFLTFDLVLFGAFTRLTDSGLGCPDWPGCYGKASPMGAREHIEVAQTAMPSGPVTHGKAWIEMIHRYLATGVGVLILVLSASGWAAARNRLAVVSPWWPTMTLIWVCVQGAFGALTVTMKLYPAIVTLHLLGGMVLLALLAAQAQAYVPSPLNLSPRLRIATWFVALLSAIQIALGGWVSTNYAVLACSDFPLCHGSWWPEMDFAQGFALLRELGVAADGSYLPFAALTAIHYVHRLVAYALLLAIAALAWAFHRHADLSARRWAIALAGVAVWQLASGLSNVLLRWPLVGAVAHTAGAAALVTLLTVVLCRGHRARRDAAPHRLAEAVP
ncbi:MAG: COX15/CtaA family protein [Burkholderiaceae bacterium]